MMRAGLRRSSGSTLLEPQFTAANLSGQFAPLSKRLC
jgi:hypothetical protein